MLLPPSALFGGLLPLSQAASLELEGNLKSCGKAAFQQSCHAKGTVDPDSFATCCYNGALQRGFQESGLVLATQFWDAEPPTGPIDSTTIHGLWPDYCSGEYPQYCTSDSDIPTYTGEQIRSALSQYAPDTLEYMNTYYKDISDDDATFWEHEFNKHGTCYTTLRAHCQIPRNGMNQTMAALVGYFEEIVKRFQKLPTYKWLAEAGIKPTKAHTYQLQAIQDALTKRHGALPYIGCINKTQLDEFWYYFNTRGPIIVGHYIPVPTTSNSSCDAEVHYVPK